jgi:ADP-ribose pyrophosphatase YjhB (NUDIX family)
MRLTDYERPSVAVDTAVLTLDETGSELLVLQVRRESAGWALPGTFLHVGERLADAVQRSLREKAGVSGLRPRQLHVFDAPGRDDRGWVLSVGHTAAVRIGQLNSRFADRTRLVPVLSPGRLIYDHPDIIAAAAADMRARYREHPDPDGLLAAEFTLRELLVAHQAVADTDPHAHSARLQRDTFRRAMSPGLKPTGALRDGGRGRPAELFRHVHNHDGRPIRR